MKNVVIIVKDGLVSEVLSTDPDIDVEVIDMDTNDPEVRDEIDKRLDEVGMLAQQGDLNTIY